MRSIVVISSFPPRFCGIATFVEEAIEFIKKADPEAIVNVISHLDGRGENVHPTIDLSRVDWYEPVADKIKELNPDVIHIQHEYGLYNHVNRRGRSDNNKGFIKLLNLIKDYPVVIEAHTIHGRLKEKEEWFVWEVLKRCSSLIVKCEYQKWRLSWTFREKRHKELLNKVAVIPHGARPDIRYGDEEIDGLKEELGLGDLVGRHMAGLVGWIQSNKRWDIVLDMWEEIEQVIYGRTGENWLIFGAGDIRDPNDKKEFGKYISKLKELEKKGIAKYFKFEPRGDIYYKVMAICDFIILPSIDETQSGTLARVIALNKPYITTAPMEGLTFQTLESEGGLLFIDRESLKRNIIRVASSERLRRKMGNNLKWYLESKVSWEIVARQYFDLYDKAQKKDVNFPPSF